jgi:hypothetical protein
LRSQIAISKAPASFEGSARIRLVPIKVRLLDSLTGESLDMLLDPEDALNQLVPRLDDDSFPLVNTIDPYGDADLLSSQMSEFVGELDRLESARLPKLQREYSEQLRMFASRCAAVPRYRLRFIGD